MLTLNCFFEITLVLRAEINPGKAAIVIFSLYFFLILLIFFIFLCVLIFGFIIVIILENKSWPFRLVFQSLVCIMGSLLFSSLFLRTKSKARRSLWSDSSLWSVPGADPRLNPPHRQGFQGAFLSVWFHSLCVWADATCSARVTPALVLPHVQGWVVLLLLRHSRKAAKLQGNGS